MTLSFTGRKRLRKNFGKIVEIAQMPNLIEVQKTSYDQFLQVEKPEGGRIGRGPGGGVPSGVPDQGFLGILAAGICRLPLRRAEIRRRGVPAALHDLCRAAQGDAAPDRVRCGPGNRRQVGQGHQGTGRLYGRRSLHDRERHLRRQRHRARHRLPDAPFAGRLLRPRQGQDPFLGQAAVRRPRHSLSRLVARLRVRRQGHHPCPHRPPPQAAGDDAALCAGPDPGRDPRLFLSARSPSSSTRTAAGPRRSIPAGCATPRPTSDWKNAKTGEVIAGSRRQDHRARACASWQEDGVKQIALRRRRADRPLLARSTWSIRRPARSMSKPATS